jgi:protoporphyrinogen oxidase
MTAQDWLIKLAGREVFRVVWEPLLTGKFGPYSSKVGAVWFWKKLALRGGSRASDGREVLAYYKGGFSELAEALKRKLEEMGVEVRVNAPVLGLDVADGCVSAVRTEGGTLPAEAVLLTQALPLIADLLQPHMKPDYIAGLRRIEYLANICLVLELDRSLSETYWLNVNDPTFPFVGVIEHTNFEPPKIMGGGTSCSSPNTCRRATPSTRWPTKRCSTSRFRTSSACSPISAANGSRATMSGAPDFRSRSRSRTTRA